MSAFTLRLRSRYAQGERTKLRLHPFVLSVAQAESKHEPRILAKGLAALISITPLAALAGGSNYGIAPGVHNELAGKLSEWPVPTPRFARDPAPAPDGSIYISVMNEINTDTVVRLDPKSEQMRVVQLPSSNVGIRKMIVDASGRLWYMGSHSGRLGLVE